jgi:uncharacterized repeat protein (TIGR03803 family)
VFAVGTDGTPLTTIHTFTAGTDGSFPIGVLTCSGNILYGTASKGGSSSHGTIFAMNMDGTGFTNLYNFTDATNGGAQPMAGVVISGNMLYGTTIAGGPSGDGIVFSFSLPVNQPNLSASPNGTNIILSWPASSAFVLQSTASLVAPAWSPIRATPAIVNGLNTVTDAISGTQKFYRLAQ